MPMNEPSRVPAACASATSERCRCVEMSPCSAVIEARMLSKSALPRCTSAPAGGLPVPGHLRDGRGSVVSAPVAGLADHLGQRALGDGQPGQHGAQPPQRVLLRGPPGGVRLQERPLGAERVAADPGLLVEQGHVQLRGLVGGRIQVLHDPVAGAGQVG